MPLGSTQARNVVMANSLGPTQADNVPDPFFLSLYDNDPTAGGNEVTGSGYQRVPVSKADWTGPADGAMTNTNDIEFPPALEAWGTIRYAALLDGSGAVWDYGVIGTVVVVPSAGFVVQFLAGDITVKEG
jgi:hypothetical protein